MESGTSASLNRWLVTLASGAMTSLDHTMVGGGEGARKPVMKRSIAVLVVGLLVMGVAACTTAGEIVEVTFDGSECTMGAAELPPGDHAFVLTDVSDRDGVLLYVNQLVDGHTYQDALDAEKEAGGPGSPRRNESWSVGVMPDVDPPEIDLADNQQLRAVSLEPGNHTLVIWAPDPPGSYGIWLCGPLDVVES